MSVMIDLDCIKSEEDGLGDNVRACRGCLATNIELQSLHEKGLDQLFGDFTGFPVVASDSYPQLICNCCEFVLRKFLAYKMRCHAAMFTLQQMEISNVKITTDSLTTIERTHIKHNLNRTDPQIISTDGTTPLTDEEHSMSEREGKTIEECMIEMEDDDKPLTHFVTSLPFDNVSVKDDYSDAGDDDELDTEVVEKPVKRKKFAKSSGLKPKRIKTEITNRKPAKQATKDTNHKSLKKECDNSIKRTTPNCNLGASDQDTTNDNLDTIDQDKRNENGNSDKNILKTVANILRRIWFENKNSNISDIWEMVYKQSLTLKDEEINFDNKALKKNSTTKQQIIRFIELTRQLAILYNMEVKFLSVEDHRREIEQRRCSEKYANAPYKCEFCCKVYIFEDTYKRHMISHDPSSGDVECEICRYRFKSRKRYMNHYHIYHTKKIVCRECGVVNRAWNFAKQHYKWHGGVTTVCDQCGKHFPDKKLYCMHVRAVHRAELVTTLCLLCGDTYNGDTGLRMHVDKAHRQAERCASCGGLFRTAEALGAHIENICDPNGSSCPLCGENYPSEEAMRQHYDDIHKKEFKCEECNKSLSTLVLYKKHIRKCLLPKGHERRRRDMNREKGIKQIYNLNLMCELCGKGNFKCFSTLRSHQRVHTGERPFRCDICQKTFRELQFLKNHMKTHTDERRYKCPFCPKAFRQMGHRAAHLLTHTKERPFACTSCSKRYTGLTALKEHVNTAHKGLPPRQRGRHKQP